MRALPRLALDPARRFLRFLDAESNATGLALRPLLFTAAGIHLLVTLLSVNPWHPDEHYQILEFAWSRAGLASPDLLPWEWNAHIRPTLQPAMALVVLKALRALGVMSPFVWVALLRIGSVVLALAILLATFARVSGSLTRTGRQTLWLTGLFLWFTPLFLGRFTSENWGGMALVSAILLLTPRAPSERADAAAGVLLGLSFLFRYQMGIPALAVVVWLLAGTGTDAGRPGWRRAATVVATAAAAAAVGILVDRWFYGMWVLAPLDYLRVNLFEGVANRYGVYPWWQYFVWATGWPLLPIGLALTGLVSLGALRHWRSPWGSALLAYVAVHSLIAHKEPRFLLPLLYLVPLLTAWGVEALPARVWVARMGQALVLLNATLLLLPSIPALHYRKGLDWHYERAVWNYAERRPGQKIYVLQDLEPGDLRPSVYQHPRVVPVYFRNDGPLPAEVPKELHPGQALLVTFGSETPSVRGADIGRRVYVSESGWRIMARQAGIEDQRWVEALDRWDDWYSDLPRRVWEVRLRSAGPDPAGG